jgi:hypothetical protein
MLTAWTVGTVAAVLVTATAVVATAKELLSSLGGQATERKGIGGMSPTCFTHPPRKRITKSEEQKYQVSSHQKKNNRDERPTNQNEKNVLAISNWLTNGRLNAVNRGKNVHAGAK